MNIKTIIKKLDPEREKRLITALEKRAMRKRAAMFRRMDESAKAMGRALDALEERLKNKKSDT